MFDENGENVDANAAVKMMKVFCAVEKLEYFSLGRSGVASPGCPVIAAGRDPASFPLKAFPSLREIGLLS